jgi:hypothetical protein
MAKMQTDDLLRFLEEEADQAFHYADGEIGADRSKSMRAYLREPYGTEEEGRSSVVASDVFDSVEGVMPDLIEIFTSSDKAVVFDPVGAEDEEGAEQATQACNYVFYKQNNGFLILYTAIKDALMLKTGGVKWCYEKKRVAEFTTYRAVDEMRLAVFLTTNPKAEVVSKEEYEPTKEDLAQFQEAQAIAEQTGMEPPVMQTRYTVKIKEVKEKGKVRIDAIPPDELHVSVRHNSVLLDDCPYVAHVVEKTLSDINQMGFKVSVDDVRAAQNDRPSWGDSSRDYGGRFGWEVNTDNENDPSMVRGWLREEYVLVDFDGDGIAERRRVLRLGDIVLENEECSHVPIAAWTPYILTHRFVGQSVADLVEDFQRIHTEIWRQQLDNLALANNQETVVLTDSQGSPMANIDDLLNRRPGGVLREKVAGAIRPYQQRWQGIEASPMLGQLERDKEMRTGYSPTVPGLDANALQKTAMEVSKTSNERQKRMKLMARIVAEALVAPMFRGIFKTLMDYSFEKLSYRLNGKFVAVDPQEWRDGYDMSINVGIGTGDEMQQSIFLQQMAQAQAMVAQSPMGGLLLTPKNVYNLQARLAENAGFKNPGEFWTDPGDQPVKPPAPPPDPRVMLEQAKMQADAQKFQAETARLRETETLKAQAKLQEIQANLELQAANDMRDSEREQAKMMAQREQFAVELEFKAQQAELDRQFKLQLEGMKNAESVLPVVEQQIQIMQERFDAMMADRYQPRQVTLPSGRVFEVNAGSGEITQIQ